jgi:excisionase family DNA binding protein
MAWVERKARDTAAIFARIPRAEAEKLERLSFELKRPKQDIIAGLVAQYVPGQEARAGEGWTLGRYGFRPAEAPEVLTLEQLAQFLQLDEDTVRALAEIGDLPGRQVGGEWRFSRQAILKWLEGGGE